MEHQEHEVYASRERKQSRYDKRLILKVVMEVEQGLPRKEANRIYGLGKSTLDGWMQDYGSQDYHENIKRQRYSTLQKRTVVTAIEQGRLSIREAQGAYNIKSEKLIRSWLSRYKSEKAELCIAKESAMPKKTTPDTSKGSVTEPVDTTQIEALKRALKEAEMKINALNTLIDVAEEQLKIDIRRKSGARQS
jgi:transposase-like protein